MTAMNVKTGKVVWQDRSFPKATFVYADGKLILLDEDGQLALVQSFAARDESPGESVRAGTYRVDAADTGGHESLPAGSPDDRGAGSGTALKGWATSLPTSTIQ